MAVRGFSCLSDETKITLRIDGKVYNDSIRNLVKQFPQLKVGNNDILCV